MEFLQNLSRKQAIMISVTVLVTAAVLVAVFYFLGRSRAVEDKDPEQEETQYPDGLRQPIPEERLQELVEQNSGPEDADKTINDDDLERIIRENSGN